MAEKTAGIREFARLCGRPHSSVVNLTKRGIIPTDEDGRIPVEAGLEAEKAYSEKVRSRRKTKEPEPEPEPESEILPLYDAKAKKETYLAAIKEMEAKVMRKEYVAVADVKADARRTAERLRAFCISAPARYAPLLEQKSQRECERILEKMFEEFLTRVHGGEFLADDEDEEDDEDDEDLE